MNRASNIYNVFQAAIAHADSCGRAIVAYELAKVREDEARKVYCTSAKKIEDVMALNVAIENAGEACETVVIARIRLNDEINRMKSLLRNA